MLVFHWFLQGIPYRSARARLGVQQQSHFRSDATLRVLLVFQWFLEVFGKPCSDPVGAFFLPSRKCMFSTVSEGSGGGAFFTGVLYNDLKRQAIGMLYVSSS